MTEALQQPPGATQAFSGVVAPPGKKLSGRKPGRPPGPITVKAIRHTMARNQQKLEPRQPVAGDPKSGTTIEDICRGLPIELHTPGEYAKALMAYLSAMGDVQVASRSCGLPPETLTRWSQENQWHLRLAELMKVRDEDGANGFAIELNRLMNLSQAVRLRGLINTIIDRVTGGETEMEEFLSEPLKYGKKFSLKCLSELAKASYNCHLATYQALGDLVAERVQKTDLKEKHKDEQASENPGDRPSLAIYKTLTQLSNASLPAPTPQTTDTEKDEASGEAPGSAGVSPGDGGPSEPR